MTASVASAITPARLWLGRAVRVTLLVAGVLPFVPLALSPVAGLDALASLVDSWFAFQCHRELGRSLTLFGATLPVCSRCAGIYFGLGLGALMARPQLSVWPLRIWVGAAALVMILDVVTELAGMRPAWTPLRVLTGVALAYPVAVALVVAARSRARDERGS